MSRKPLKFGLTSVCLLGLSTGCFSTTPPETRAEGKRASSASAARCITPEDAERMADQVLQLVNLERAERNLQPVTENGVLRRIAGRYACGMVEGRFFGHRDPITGHGPAERAATGKYRFYAVGENLAAGQETAAEVMKVWMESPPHRAIILDPNWKDVGIAARVGGEHSIYWVQEFGDPADY